MLIVDWGTTSLRIYKIREPGLVEEVIESRLGIMNVTNNDFSSVLSELLNPSDMNDQIVMFGMIGSKNGWHETPYVQAPTAVNELINHAQKYSWASDSESITPFWIMPGVKLEKSDGQVEVMRGEETQIIGFLETEPTFNGKIVLPGTHSKWIAIRDGYINDIRTYMTGDVYNAVLDSTILKYTTLQNCEPCTKSFLHGAELSSKKQSITNLMFQARSKVLNYEWDPSEATNYLSGLLIGHEVRQELASNEDIRIIGCGELSNRYSAIFSYLNHHADVIDQSVVSYCETTFKSLL